MKAFALSSHKFDNFAGNGGIVEMDTESASYGMEGQQVGGQQFFDLANHMAQALVVHRAGRVLFMNRAALDFVGITSFEDRTYQSVLDFVHPDFQQLAMQRMQQLAEVEKLSEIKMRFCNIKGQVRDVCTSSYNSVFEDTPCIITIFSDITEDEIKEYQRTLTNRLIQHSPTVLVRWLADKNWSVDYVSENIKQFGYDPEELLSSRVKFYEMIEPSDMPRLKSELTEFRRLGLSSYEQSYRLRCKNGEVRWIQDRTSIERDEQGRPTHSQGLLTDVTQQYEAEESLNKRESRFRLLFETAPIGMVIASISGIILRANTAFCEMVGQEHHALFGRKFEALLEGFIDGNDLSRHQIYTEGYLETKLIFASKQTVDVMLHTTFERDAKGYPVQMLFQVTNITERKRTEQQLQDSNLELDSFVYKASHDMRAPLRTILGLVDLSERADSWEEVMKYVGLISKSTQKLDLFVLDLIEYSINSRTELQVGELNIEDIVMAAVAQTRELSDRPVTIHTHFSLPVPYVSDQRRLTSILSNILSNAFIYQAETRTHEVVVTATVSHMALTVVIVDNGIGISENQIDKIFGMFHRSSELSKGAGLGLYIAKNLAQRLGGEIRVMSTHGIGSSFTVVLPNTGPHYS